jgi:hypothetical protein
MKRLKLHEDWTNGSQGYESCWFSSCIAPGRCNWRPGEVVLLADVIFDDDYDYHNPVVGHINEYFDPVLQLETRIAETQDVVWAIGERLYCRIPVFISEHEAKRILRHPATDLLARYWHVVLQLNVDLI